MLIYGIKGKSTVIHCHASKAKHEYIRMNGEPDTVGAIAQPDGTWACDACGDFKRNREEILNSVSWMHERYQSQISLVNHGETLEPDWTAAEGIEYYRWKQALRVIPQGGDGWENSFTWPIVPQHVYEGMTEEIQQLCTELGCAP